MQNYYYYTVALAFCAYMLYNAANRMQKGRPAEVFSTFSATLGMIATMVLVVMAFWHTRWWHVAIVGVVSFISVPSIEGMIEFGCKRRVWIEHLFFNALSVIIYYIGVAVFAYLAFADMLTSS